MYGKLKLIGNIIQRLILLFVVLILGCSQRQALKTEIHSIKYLALGDSYTIGESVTESQRYPVQLASRLRENGYKIDEPVIIAKTGWTTDELAAGIEAGNPQGPYDLVSLLIGVNNQYRGRSVDEYRPEFRALLRQAIDFTGGDPQKVFVLSIPDWGVTPFAEDRDRDKIANEIDEYNSVNREESEKSGVLYIDVTPVSRQAAEDVSLIADDGLHPSGKMYEEWVRLALPGVIKIPEKSEIPDK